jgi:ABC-2 type transport system permease protein
MMKVFDIALKDMTRSMRSAFALVFMFGVPLLVTGMFYFMFGNIASQGEFNLPQISVVIANLDEGGPKFQTNTKNIPGGSKADTMGELVAGILQSEDLAELLDARLVPQADAARAAVDSQQAQVAIIIPPDFSTQFADIDGTAAIEFYQDPTLTIGPGIVRSILNQFMDGMSGVKIAVNVAIDEAGSTDYALVGQVVQQYLDVSLAQSDDPEAALLEIRNPQTGAVDEAQDSRNTLVGIVTPIMGGMMIFYAFYTGTATAQSILREEEEHTLPRLFTTPTPQSVILSGKFLAVFLTVLVQVAVLLTAARLIFGIQWGALLPVALMAGGTVFAASAFGIFVNSFLKDTRQGGVVFGGVLTVTGMIGMIGIFAMNSPTGQKLANSVSLLVPQGWAVRGLMQAVESRPVEDVLVSTLVMLGWSAAFFAIGVWRFNRRYV